MTVAAGAITGALGVHAGQSSRQMALHGPAEQLCQAVYCWLLHAQYTLEDEVRNQKTVACPGVNV